jgi:hypothetical protein
MWDDFDPVKVEREIFNAGEAYFLHRGTTTKEAQAALKKLIESIEAVIPLFKKNSPMARVLMPSIAVALCSQLPKDLSLLRTTGCVVDGDDTSKIAYVFRHYLAGLCEPEQLLTAIVSAAREALMSEQVESRHGGQHRVRGHDGFGNWKDMAANELGTAIVRIYTFTTEDFAIPAKVPKGSDNAENPRCNIEEFTLLCLRFYEDQFGKFPQLSTLRPALIDGYWWIDFGSGQITTRPKRGRKPKVKIPN